MGGTIEVGTPHNIERQDRAECGKGTELHWRGDTAQKKIAHSDKATYTAAVCKFRGGHFFLVRFGFECGTAQPLQLILGCLRRAHPPP